MTLASDSKFSIGSFINGRNLYPSLMYVVRIEISPEVELLTTRLGLGNQVSYGAISCISAHLP